jgi:hypothetical protein
VIYESTFHSSGGLIQFLISEHLHFSLISFSSNDPISLLQFHGILSLSDCKVNLFLQQAVDVTACLIVTS